MQRRILIVDDHQIVRTGVRALLATERPHWNVIEAEGGREAVRIVTHDSPNLIVMDITMPGSSGLEVAARLRELGFAQPILMFTMHDSNRMGDEAKSAGAQGYVTKSQASDDLVRAIETLLDGGTFFGAPAFGKPKANSTSGGAIFFLGLGWAEV